MDKAQIKSFIAARVAKELKDGDVVNLGIGIPTMVPGFLPENVHVTLLPLAPAEPAPANTAKPKRRR